MLARVVEDKDIPPDDPRADRVRRTLGNVGRGWVWRLGGSYTSSGRMGHGGNDDAGGRDRGVDSVTAGEGACRYTWEWRQVAALLQIP